MAAPDKTASSASRGEMWSGNNSEISRRLGVKYARLLFGSSSSGSHAESGRTTPHFLGSELRHKTRTAPEEGGGNQPDSVLPSAGVFRFEGGVFCPRNMMRRP
jgi:hypothetical protein